MVPGATVSLPPWWPRHRCVYCGALTRERDPENARRPFSRLACWRHISLLASDPMQAATVGEAEQSREGKAI